MAKRIKTSGIFKEAEKYLAGGVDSPVRAFNYTGGEPLVIKRGRGSKIYDHDSNEYIDYVLSWGSLILGHADPKVVKSVRSVIGGGFGFGTTNIKEVELARLIRVAIPYMEKMRFVNSGTEAVMGAVRLARGYTGRDDIVKFENSYHGHADYLLAKSGSGLATLGIPSSAGVPRDFTRHTIVLPFDDIEAVEEAFKKRGHNIAAVIIEPIGGNFGVRVPREGFVKKLRDITSKYNSLLIFDEVITGFRFRFGSVSVLLGVTPDLIVLGKIIGAGLPIGAYGGRKEIMARLSPLGDVYQASTFAGNPAVMQAGITTLKRLSLSKGQYKRIEKLTEFLTGAIEKSALSRNIDLKIMQSASAFSLKFGDVGDFRRFYKAMLEEGIYLAPSEFESNFLSFAHTKEDIEKTIDAAVKALGRI